MSASKTPLLGICPSCEAEVATRDVIIEYEKGGQPMVYAECPGCREVVNPE